MTDKCGTVAKLPDGTELRCDMPAGHSSKGWHSSPWAFWVEDNGVPVFVSAQHCDGPLLLTGDGLFVVDNHGVPRQVSLS